MSTGEAGSADRGVNHTARLASASRSSENRERKPGQSCSECRRSKLKCDRSVPCQACIRRGCSAICPNGTLAATKGNKVLQAKADKLEEEVETMRARIRELESALRTAQDKLRMSSQFPKPETQTEPPNREPDSVDKDPRLLDAIGSLSIKDDGAVKYFEKEALRTRDPKLLGFPDEIVRLVQAFPFGLPNASHEKVYFLPYIPPKDVALHLVDLYYDNASWQFNPVPRDEFDETIYNPLYTVVDQASLAAIHPHQLSLFFSILSLGMLWRDYPTAQVPWGQYYSLACGAMSLQPITRSVTCTTLQALFCINRSLNLASREAVEECWLIHSITVRLSQMMALLYDGLAFKLSRAELQRRRVMFWELYTWDAWKGFVTGRVPGQKPGELGFHAWNFRYAAALLPPSLKIALRPAVISYESLLDLDKRIRAFPIPEHLQLDLQSHSPRGRPWSSHPIVATRQCNVLFVRESNLLYLHRPYFAVAVREKPADPLSHKYGPSVLAAYRSACKICKTLRGLYLLHPRPVQKIWYFWTQLFSSCVLLAALVLGSPRCSLAQQALIELDSASAFFEEGSVYVRPSKTLVLLSRLKVRAKEVYASRGSAGQHDVPQGPQAPSSDPFGDLGILSGRIGVIRHSSESPGSSPPANDPNADYTPLYHTQANTQTQTHVQTHPQSHVQPHAHANAQPRAHPLSHFLSQTFAHTDSYYTNQPQAGPSHIQHDMYNADYSNQPIPYVPSQSSEPTNWYTDPSITRFSQHYVPTATPEELPVDHGVSGWGTVQGYVGSDWEGYGGHAVAGFQPQYPTESASDGNQPTAWSTFIANLMSSGGGEY
ncbi:hypothetical protein K474DRAFT_862934 [Panus rudis PR-1116 ss-1]|nr:hypothetical protein K474DRAFT_862934 [Panus rudis PR-1116 ss-1]